MSEVLRTPAGLAGAALTVALVLLAALAPVLAPADPFASVGAPLTPPSRSHALGTDDLGRDVYSGILHGTRTSLVVALGVVAIAATLGVFVGAVAGFRGGSVDEVILATVPDSRAASGRIVRSKNGAWSSSSWRSLAVIWPSWDRRAFSGSGSRAPATPNAIMSTARAAPPATRMGSIR